MGIQALGAECSVEAFDMGVIRRLAGPGEVDLHLMVSPEVQDLTYKFTAVTEQHLGLAPLFPDAIKNTYRIRSFQRLGHFDGQAFSRVHVDHRERSEPLQADRQQLVD